MKTYYLYRLENSLIGDKCGATSDWKKRCIANRRDHGHQCIITVLETMEGPNTPEYWQVVGDREWELAAEYGYPKGHHYRHARTSRFKTTIASAAKGQITKILRDNQTNGPRSLRIIDFDLAQEIRSKYVPLKYTAPMLAKEYNIKLTTIKALVQGRTYLKP
jgi:hypothetical protein